MELGPSGRVTTVPCLNGYEAQNYGALVRLGPFLLVAGDVDKIVFIRLIPSTTEHVVERQDSDWLVSAFSICSAPARPLPPPPPSLLFTDTNRGDGTAIVGQAYHSIIGSLL